MSAEPKTPLDDADVIDLGLDDDDDPALLFLKQRVRTDRQAEAPSDDDDDDERAVDVNSDDDDDEALPDQLEVRREARGGAERSASAHKAWETRRANAQNRGAATDLAEDADAEEEEGDREDEDEDEGDDGAAAEVLPRARLEDFETEEVMAVFRQVLRPGGERTRLELLREVARGLGFKRLGRNIEDGLRGHLRAAIRREIVGVEGVDTVMQRSRNLADYDREEIRERLSQMTDASGRDQEEVMRLVAAYYGFRRLTEGARAALRTAINSAIRHGVIERDGARLLRR